MKHDQIIVAALAFLAIALCPLAGRAQDENPEKANRALAAAFESAWNTHDWVAFGKLLTEDVDWVNINAGHGKGQDTVVKNHARVHNRAGKFKDSVMTVKGVEVALLKSDVALVHVYWAIRGDRNDDGTPRQPREGLFTWVTVKHGVAWKIRASHNTNKSEIH